MCFLVCLFGCLLSKVYVVVGVEINKCPVTITTTTTKNVNIDSDTKSKKHPEI